MDRTTALHTALDRFATAAGLPRFEALGDLALTSAVPHGQGLLAEVPVPPVFATLIEHARVYIIPYARVAGVPQGYKLRWTAVLDGREVTSYLGCVVVNAEGDAWDWRLERERERDGYVPFTGEP